MGIAPRWASAFAAEASANVVNGVTLLRSNDGTGRCSMRFADETAFFIDARPNEARMWATWPTALTADDTATYLMGPVFAFYLRMLGHVCLHGSAAVIDGRCFVFLGPGGSGKSTLVAALAVLGDSVLTEDVACLESGVDAISVRPGYPLVRLWETSEHLLAGSVGKLPRLTPNWGKRYLPLGSEKHRFHAQSAPLAAVFVLNPRQPMADAARVEPLSGQEAMTNLVANTYGNYLLDRAMRANEFRVLGRLAGSVPVRSLTLNADGSRLFEACEWLRENALRP